MPLISVVMSPDGDSTASAQYLPAVRELNPPSVNEGTKFGGRVGEFAVDSANPQIVFAATEYGGLFRSTNGGTLWNHVEMPLTATNDVQIAESDPSLVIATGAFDGTNNQAPVLYISRNGGASWARATTTTTCGTDNTNAYNIAIAPGSPGSLSIFVADDCGILTSTNSGKTWSHVDPSGLGGRYQDVEVRKLANNNLQLDTCGNNGYFRSTDGGATWSAKDTSVSRPIQLDTLATNPKAAVGYPPCYVATAPQDPNTVFLTFPFNIAVNGINQTGIIESDQAGAPGTWVALNGPAEGNGRPPNVITVREIGSADDKFEIYYANDSRFVRQTCDIDDTPRCKVGAGDGAVWKNYDDSIAKVHNAPDAHDLAINPATGCPFLEAGDAGAFRTSNGCDDAPTFEASNVGLDALQATSMTGSVHPDHTSVYFGTQDNGIWSTGFLGSYWSVKGPDVYATLADHNGPPSSVLWATCCGVSNNQVTGNLNLWDEAMTSAKPFKVPPGYQPPFNFYVAQFGYQSYAVITADKAPGPTVTQKWQTRVTTDGGKNWANMGPNTTNSPLAIVAAGPANAPVFYINLNVGGTPTIYKLSGALDTTATLTTVNTGLTFPLGPLAVNPSDANQLYVVDWAGANPGVHFSIDGGATWSADTNLNSRMTAGGRQMVGNRGALPTAIGIDQNSETIMVGTVDAGIWRSEDSGATWNEVAGGAAIPRAVGFFFDELNDRIYVASAGRGLWQIRPQPVVTDVSPKSGSLLGGDKVVITGAGFNGATKVEWGGVSVTPNCSLPPYCSASRLVVVTPPHQAGIFHTIVTANGEKSSQNFNDSFTFEDRKPQVYGMQPRSASTSTPTTVTVIGQNFPCCGTESAPSVLFGSLFGTDVNVVSQTQLTVKTPVAPPGTVDVRVSSGQGISDVTPSDRFSFITGPNITAVSPEDGPDVGGTDVTLSGSGFTGATEVLFGSKPAANFTVKDDNTIVANSPPGNGPVHIRVRGPQGQSAITPDDEFEYHVAPAVTSVVPSGGVAGQEVAVFVSNLEGPHTTRIFFGSNEAKIIQRHFIIGRSDSDYIVIAPPGSGTVTVTVSSEASGTSVPNPPHDQYEYTG